MRRKWVAGEGTNATFLETKLGTQHPPGGRILQLFSNSEPLPPVRHLVLTAVLYGSQCFEGCHWGAARVQLTFSY